MKPFDTHPPPQREPAVAVNPCDLPRGATRSHLPHWFDLKSDPAAPGARRLTTVVAPVDGSTWAEHALPMALTVARQAGAALRLVCVHSSSELVYDPWHFVRSDASFAQVRQRKLRYLDELMERIGQFDDVPLSAMLIEDRNKADSLSALAEHADLIVMTTHGRGLVGRIWHGSLSASLLQRVDCPLLLVHGHNQPGELRPAAPVRHVLVPLNGSRFAEEVLGVAAAFGRWNQAACTLMSVDVEQDTPSIGCFEHADAIGYLQHWARELQPHVAAVHTEVVREARSVARAILTVAEQRQVDLIAMTTHGRGELSRLAHASAVDGVLRHSRLPLFLLPRHPRHPSGGG